MKKTKVDKKIFLKNKEWSFSKKIAPLFDYHINKSIPFYKDFQWLCNEVSDYFIKDKSNVYDLGCSTGSYTKRLALRHKNKKDRLSPELKNKLDSLGFVWEVK